MSRREFVEQDVSSPEVAARLAVVAGAVRFFENVASAQHPNLFAPEAPAPITGVNPNIDADTLAAMAARESYLQQPGVGDVRAA